jgi:HSP20 family protein
MTTVWNPWREMHRLRREMDQLFNPEWWPAARRTGAFPPVNMWSNEQGVVLTAELPGIDPAELDVSVEKDSLTLCGKRAGQPAQEDDQFVRRERWFEPFSRTIDLPFEVDPDRCEASYEKGVLTLKLQRAPEHQPKKLTIKAG